MYATVKGMGYRKQVSFCTLQIMVWWNLWNDIGLVGQFLLHCYSGLSHVAIIFSKHTKIIRRKFCKHLLRDVDCPKGSRVACPVLKWFIPLRTMGYQLYEVISLTRPWDQTGIDSIPCDLLTLSEWYSWQLLSDYMILDFMILFCISNWHAMYLENDKIPQTVYYKCSYCCIMTEYFQPQSMLK